jgi:hypothetical protein
MNKKVIVVLILLFLVYFLFKAKKATAATVSQGSADESAAPVYEDENFIFWDFEPYEVKQGDWLSKLAGNYIDTSGLTQEAKLQILLDFTRSLALFNGFNWAEFDNVASESAEDPDNLVVGQILSLPVSWASKKMYDLENV